MFEPLKPGDYKTLKKRIAENPLTEEEFLREIKENIGAINFSNKIWLSGKLVNSKIKNKHDIIIKYSQSEKNRKKSLVHEVSHSYYNVLNGLINESRSVENLIERETDKFYKNNKAIVDLYYNSLLVKWKKFGSPKCPECIVECFPKCAYSALEIFSG